MDSKPTTFHEGDTVSKINSDPTDQILDGEIGIVTELGERYVKVLFIGQEHHFFMPPNKLDVMYCVQPAPAEAAQPVAGDDDSHLFGLLNTVAMQGDDMNSWLKWDKYHKGFAKLNDEQLIYHYNVTSYYERVGYAYIRLTAKGWTRWHELQSAPQQAEIATLREQLAAVTRERDAARQRGDNNHKLLMNAVKRNIELKGQMETLTDDLRDCEETNEHLRSS